MTLCINFIFALNSTFTLAASMVGNVLQEAATEMSFAPFAVLLCTHFCIALLLLLLMIVVEICT